ncbi:MAG: Kazal-type serine protease inhibitor [Candidatus Nealsonbacteria bacterium]
MLKKIFLIIIVVTIVGAAGYWLYQQDNAEVKIVFDPKNITYTVEGNAIATVWGEPSPGDLNSDKVNDAALIVTSEPGGTGTFYYVTAALQDAPSGKALGLNAILLGDRIAPQNISIDNGKIMVNYADRKLSEPFTTRPSIGITRYFEVQDSVLTEVTEDSAKKEQACLLSSGTIGTSLCCKLVGDFPNTGLIGACGCSPDNSHEVKVCNCGPDRVFDGTGCVSQTIFCQPSQRQGDVCFQIYDPVCANPLNQTFSNPCEACRNPLVESYTRGQCAN